MTEQKATESTTDDTLPQAPPTFGIVTYGSDPVIVDDGGSTRVEQRGKAMAGQVTQADPSLANGFKPNSLLSVFSLTQNGPLCAALPLILDDVVTVWSGTNTITLTMKSNRLELYSNTAADHHPGNANGHDHYHVPQTGLITKITHLRSGNTTLILARALHGSSLVTTVAVHPIIP